MQKSKLYTRTGDKGSTSLVGGQRVPKESPRIEAYGTIDELSSHLGVVASLPGCDPTSRQRILSIQHTLFDIGSWLATEITPEVAEQPWCPKPPEPRQIADLESWIDQTDALTPPMHYFVLPGGTPEAAHTHVARTVCRRAERRILSLARDTEVDSAIIEYVNRLSDYLFILARSFNAAAGKEDIPWKPEAKRDTQK